MTALDRRTERWLDLFGDVPEIKVTLGPPHFMIPDAAAAKLGLPSCAACGNAVNAPAHGLIRWQGNDYHPTCVHDELLALGVAA